MSIPRLRMVAGPNGSGKTTLLRFLEKTLAFPLGHNLNPDLLEADLFKTGRLHFETLNVETSKAAVKSFLNSHPLAERIAGLPIAVTDNALSITPGIPMGYLAAVLSDFLRKQWLASGQSFVFETVMSSADKIGLLEQARRTGFRTYLYYVCTDNAEVNIDRVKDRVHKGGHDVPAARIQSRYIRSQALLPAAIRESDRAYIFDNSGSKHLLIAEYQAGRLIAAAPDLPTWFVNAALNSK